MKWLAIIILLTSCGIDDRKPLEFIPDIRHTSNKDVDVWIDRFYDTVQARKIPAYYGIDVSLVADETILQYGTKSIIGVCIVGNEPEPDTRKIYLRESYFIKAIPCKQGF
jgi:hypothetical protein